MLRVAAVPEAHPYVQHIRPLNGAVTTYLPEDFHEGRRWWPPIKFDPAWLHAHAAELDILHVHFGLESYWVDHVAAVARAARERGIALVVTVHDLQHPHLPDDTHHAAQLDVLVPAADAVITLTPGAANEIRLRWAASATVIPHPHVVPLKLIADTTPTTGHIAVHLKDLRAAVDVRPLVDDLAVLAARYPVHVYLQDPPIEAGWREQQGAIGALERAGITLHRHGRLSDAELFARVRRSVVQVLPYRRGTHSGWAEMCQDLGVAVAVPAVGFIREQHDGPARVAVYDASTTGSLATAVRSLLGARIDDQGSWRQRRAAQRAYIARAHEQLYQRVTLAHRHRR